MEASKDFFSEGYQIKVVYFDDLNLKDPFTIMMVPKGGFEPPRGLPTTPSRWRVYQFHHFGIRAIVL
jgi:hypothetical protein